jgi:hypothetical protein
MYFKPPEVEPLADLFASGELAALLKTDEGAEEAAPVDTTKKEEEVEKIETPEDEEEQASSGSGLKRNNLRSSFRMYENRYRAEALERRRINPHWPLVYLLVVSHPQLSHQFQRKSKSVTVHQGLAAVEVQLVPMEMMSYSGVFHLMLQNQMKARRTRRIKGTKRVKEGEINSLTMNFSSLTFTPGHTHEPEFPRQ